MAKSTRLFFSQLFMKKWNFRSSGIKLFLSLLFLSFFARSINAQCPTTPTLTMDGNPSDWPCVLKKSTYIASFKTDPANVSTSSDDQFTNGSADPDPISPEEGRGSWTWNFGNTNNKTDITNAGAALLTLNNINSLYFFADRTINNGSAEIHTWFFRSPVSLLIDGSGKFSGKHTADSDGDPTMFSGDILIVSEFTQGGSKPLLKVYNWIGGKNPLQLAFTIDPTQSNNLGDAAVNATPQTVPTDYPGWTYTTSGGVSGTYPIGDFFEGYLNLTALKISPCFTTFLTATRNSPSQNASLQDFVINSFDAKPKPPTTTPDTQCEGTNLVLKASCNGGSNPRWYTTETGGTPLTTADGVSQDGTSLTKSGLAVGSYDYWVSCYNAALGCESATRTKVTGTVVSKPTVNQPGNQVVCNGDNTAPVTFSGTPSTGVTYSWSIDKSIGLTPTTGTGNIAAFKATNSTNAPIVATITVTPSNSSGLACPGTPKTFTITVNPTPSVDKPDNQVVCNGDNTAAINFTGAVAGTVYEWSIDKSIGLTPTTGTGNIAAFKATNSTNAPIVATITVTPKYTNAGKTCTGEAKTCTITVNPTPTVDKPGDQTICNGGNTTKITFVGAVSGTVYEWTNDNTSIGLAASGSGDIEAFKATNSTNVTAVANITVTPKFTNAGKTCTGEAKSFKITVNPDGVAPNLEYIHPECLDKTFKVKVTNPQVNSTYILDQLDGNVVNSGKYVSGDLIFTNLHIGEGYRVIAKTDAGCKSLPDACGDFKNIPLPSSPNPVVRSGQVTDIDARIETPMRVIAAPNPFNDRIRFTLKSSVSGQGSLELYNILGQKVKTVYQGYVKADQVQTIEYAVPAPQRSNLIYLFRVGNEKATGKLIGLKQ